MAGYITRNAADAIFAADRDSDSMTVLHCTEGFFTHNATDEINPCDIGIGKRNVFHCGIVNFAKKSLIIVRAVYIWLNHADAADGIPLSVKITSEDFGAAVVVAADGGVVAVVGAVAVAVDGQVVRVILDVGAQLEELAAVVVAAVHLGSQVVKSEGGADYVGVVFGAAALPIDDGPLGIESDFAVGFSGEVAYALFVGV